MNALEKGFKPPQQLQCHYLGVSDGIVLASSVIPAIPSKIWKEKIWTQKILYVWPLKSF